MTDKPFGRRSTDATEYRPPGVRAPHPGTVLLRDYLEPLEISVQTLSFGIHMGTNGLYLICRGVRALTPECALRLARFFADIPSEKVPAGHEPTDPLFWLRLQAIYDIDQIQSSEGWRDQAPYIAPYDFPGLSKKKE